MDTVNDGPVRYGIPNINDTQTVTEMVASGAHMIVFTTGAGSVVGQAVAPVIKVVSNSRVFQRLSDDIDINAGTIADGAETIDEVGDAHRRARWWRWRRGDADPVGGARPPGIRPELQDLRAARPGLPAGLSVRSRSGRGKRGRLPGPADNREGEGHVESEYVWLPGRQSLGARGRAPASARAEDDVRLRLNWMYYGSHAPFALGKDKGYFKENGINLDIRSGNGSGSAHRLVANGDSDFSYGSCASMINLAAGGAPLVSVGVIDARAPRRSSSGRMPGVKAIADLKGKTLLTTANAGVNTFFPLVLKNAGLAEVDVASPTCRTARWCRAICRAPAARSACSAASTTSRPRSRPMAASSRSPSPIPTSA